MGLFGLITIIRRRGDGVMEPLSCVGVSDDHCSQHLTHCHRHLAGVQRDVAGGWALARLSQKPPS